MTDNKLTPWYPAGSKPARDGVYQVRENAEDKEESYSLFKYGGWHFFCDTVEQAYESVSSGHGFYLQNREWRGMAQENGKVVL